MGQGMMGRRGGSRVVAVLAACAAAFAAASLAAAIGYLGWMWLLVFLGLVASPVVAVVVVGYSALVRLNRA